MRTAVDTVVLLDVLLPDLEFGPRSRAALVRQDAAGELVACDVVWAELRARFASATDFRAAVATLGLRFDALDTAAAERAGDLWKAHRRAGGRRERVVADFFIGAHALERCDALLTRDRGFYRRFFKGLHIVEP